MPKEAASHGLVLFLFAVSICVMSCVILFSWFIGFCILFLVVSYFVALLSVLAVFLIPLTTAKLQKWNLGLLCCTSTTFIFLRHYFVSLFVFLCF